MNTEPAAISILSVKTDVIFGAPLSDDQAEDLYEALCTDEQLEYDVDWTMLYGGTDPATKSWALSGVSLISPKGRDALPTVLDWAQNTEMKPDPDDGLTATQRAWQTYPDATQPSPDA